MESNGIVINRIKTSAKKKETEKERRGGKKVNELQMGDLLCRTIPDFRGQ